MPIEELKSAALGELFGYDNNARTHSDEQVAQIAASITEFGFTNPLLVDPDMRIIAGHGRLAAAQLLDLQSVPVIVLAGLTNAQKRAYVIADNQLALSAGWDFDLLKLEIEALQTDEFDVGLLGFSPEELTHVLDGWDSDIEIPVLDEDGNEMFKVKVTGEAVDKDDVLSTLQKAIAESGIEGVTIEAA